MSTIAASKKRYYDSLICKSTNKTKTVWNIVKTVANKRINPNKIVTMNINNCPTNNPVTIVNIFNSFFSSVTENLINKPLDNNCSSDPLLYLNLNFTKPTSSLTF